MDAARTPPSDKTSHADAAEPDVLRALRRGLAQARRGLGRTVDDVFADLEREV